MSSLVVDYGRVLDTSCDLDTCGVINVECAESLLVVAGRRGGGRGSAATLGGWVFGS